MSNTVSDTTRAIDIEAEWTPHDAQAEIMASSARFRIVAAGRRFGKTQLAAREAVQYTAPDALIWWVAPTYDEADRGFDAVKAALPRRLVEDTKESWPKSVTLRNGATFEFRSTERQNSNRGEGLDLLVLDEADDIRDAAWTEDLRPSLSDTQGDMIAISTPMRRGWFYRWFERGQSPDYPQVDSWQFPTSANTHIPDGEIEDARDELPAHSFEQEYLAEFKEETGGVFTGLDDYLFTGAWELPAGGADPYATGVDLARHEDWTVITTLDADGRLVAWDRLRDVAWPTIQSAVESRAEEYPGPVAVDASRDNKLVADLERAGVQVDAVKFTSQRKADLIEGLAASIESGDLTAPDTDTVQQLKHELQIFEYDITAAGNVRYGAPQGFHDDAVDSLALANDARSDAAQVDVRIINTGGGLF